MIATPTFRPSRPGPWELDTSHFQRPVTRYLAERGVPLIAEGIAAVFNRYGLLLSTVDQIAVDGFVYTSVRPIGVPAGVAVTPPEWLFKLVMTLHPEIRRRLKTLDETFADRRWRQDAARWERLVRPATMRAHLALQAIDPASLPPSELLAHLDACEAQVRAMIRQHHEFDMACILPAAVFLAKAQGWTGLPLQALMPLFVGASPLSLGASAELSRLGAALRADPEAAAIVRPESDAGAVLAALRGRAGEVGEAMAAFEQVSACHVLEGYDLDAPCLGELPALMRSLLSGAMHGGIEPSAEPNEANAVRGMVPAAEREAFDAWLGEARQAYRLRDERNLLSDNWALGLMRRALLAIGRRLHSEGRLLQADHMIEASWHEMRALAAGSGGPTAEALAARAAYRAGFAVADAPRHLGGPPAVPPPPAWFPTENARLAARAMGLYIEAMFQAPPARSDRTSLRGLPASAGSVEGVARVVLQPADLARLQPGDILVSRTTNAAINGILPLLTGIVTDGGGVLSHAAIVAREFGIAGVVGTTDATRLIPDGARVRVDGTQGTVTILERPHRTA